METENEKIITAYKGMDKDMKCRDFQYEVGKTYETDKKPVKCTENGFHSCKYPLDVFNYYAPNNSRYFLVGASGNIDKDNDDTKIASSKIKIGMEIGIPGLVKAAIEYTKSRSTVEKDATGYSGASSATGDRGASSATGYYGASSAGNKTAIAVSWGVCGKAKGVLGAHIVCAEWKENNNGEWKLKGAKMIKVDGVKIKEDTFYTLKNGKFIEADNDV